MFVGHEDLHVRAPECLSSYHPFSIEHPHIDSLVKKSKAKRHGGVSDRVSPTQDLLENIMNDRHCGSRSREKAKPCVLCSIV